MDETFLIEDQEIVIKTGIYILINYFNAVADIHYVSSLCIKLLFELNLYKINNVVII